MRIALFCHTLRSDWNHGNAHFLRGMVREWTRRGHVVTVHEPADAWSLENLRREHGEAPLRRFTEYYPTLDCRPYPAGGPDLDAVLAGVDLVLVHEWNDPALVRAIGEHRAAGGGDYRLLFHDTHHRAATAPADMARFDLRHYDGVLAFGDVIRDIYLREGWAARAWTWHEAADAELCGMRSAERGMRNDQNASNTPHSTLRTPHSKDLVWVGNWGDDERTAELHEYLLDPVRALGLSATVHGVRYPSEALTALAEAGIHYGGWVANFDAPAVFARHRVTVHVPRRPYTLALPGIPTIRVFEALACGIPLVSAPWEDTENLFTPGKDFLFVGNGREMRERLRDVLHDPDLAANLRQHGCATIAARHTCAHRADELEHILTSLT